MFFARVPSILPTQVLKAVKANPNTINNVRIPIERMMDSPVFMDAESMTLFTVHTCNRLTITSNIPRSKAINTNRRQLRIVRTRYLMTACSCHFLQFPRIAFFFIFYSFVTSFPSSIHPLNPASSSTTLYPFFASNSAAFLLRFPLLQLTAMVRLRGKEERAF